MDTSNLHRMIADLDSSASDTACVLYLVRILYSLSALGGIALLLSCLRG